jgi:hypothetical protein
MKTKNSTAKTANHNPQSGRLRILCAAILLALLALTPKTTATELLLNRSFDEYGANWMVNPLATTPFFSTLGEANLHGKAGFFGVTLLWQDLDVAGAGGAAASASITMHKVSAPAGNTIAVYLEYTVASGATNRLLLLNPNNADVTTSTTFSTNFTVPAEAQRLVRFAVDKTISGEFHAEEFSLDVVTSAPVPPVLKLIPVASGNLGFQWDATLGNTYQVQTTTNLGSTNWINLGSSFVATNSPVAVTNALGTDAARFYRVQATTN